MEISQGTGKAMISALLVTYTFLDVYHHGNYLYCGGSLSMAPLGVKVLVWRNLC